MPDNLTLKTTLAVSPNSSLSTKLIEFNHFQKSVKQSFSLHTLQQLYLSNYKLLTAYFYSSKQMQTHEPCLSLCLHTNRHTHINTNTDINKHLLVSGACSGHLSVVPLLHLWGSRPFSWHPSQLWPSCQPAAAPHGIYLSAGRLESEQHDRREVFL